MYLNFLSKIDRHFIIVNFCSGSFNYLPGFLRLSGGGGSTFHGKMPAVSSSQDVRKGNLGHCWEGFASDSLHVNLGIFQINFLGTVIKNQSQQQVLFNMRHTFL